MKQLREGSTSNPSVPSQNNFSAVTKYVDIEKFCKDIPQYLQGKGNALKVYGDLKNCSILETKKSLE